jgi:alpha-tubulin suppressor-like RCC1 family protein
MAKIKCGDMYMVQLDHPSNLYAWSVSRTWWKPWRYSLHFHYIGTSRGIDDYISTTDGETYSNLTLEKVKGILKLMELWKDK